MPDGFVLMPGASAGNSITLLDFTTSFAAKVTSVDTPYIHPSGAAIVREWLGEMQTAAAAGDAGDIARLADLVREKIADEAAWHEEKLRRIRVMRQSFQDSQHA
jgi:hypothetical protein